MPIPPSDASSDFGVIDVTDYGAVGDGVADDTTALNAALGAAADAGSTCYLPPGTYMTTGAVTPEASSGFVRIVGAGQDATIVKALAGVPADGAVLSLLMPGEITDLTVDGNGTVVPSTTTYSVLSVGNGLDAAWANAALRRVTARNINPNVPNNGWNLVVWLSNSAAPLIGVLELEDVTVQGPSATNFDAMAVNSFDTCFVNNMRLLDLSRSPNFYQGNLLVADGIYSNGVSGIAECVIDTGVARAFISHYADKLVAGSPSLMLNSPYVELASSLATNGLALNNGALAQEVILSDCTVSIDGNGGNNMFVNNQLARFFASNCAFPYQPQIRCANSGPMHFSNCDFTMYSPGSGIFNGNASTNVADFHIEGGRTNIGTNALVQGIESSSTASVRGLVGYNPRGALTAPAVPASGTAQTNTFLVDATVYVAGGTVTAIDVAGTATGVSSGPVRVAAGQTITLTYTAAPTWTWFGD
ncbi:MAG: glycosyl hydrolase family 28-related protein [Dermatophilaceae bacterium]